MDEQKDQKFHEVMWEQYDKFKRELPVFDKDGALEAFLKRDDTDLGAERWSDLVVLVSQMIVESGEMAEMIARYVRSYRLAKGLLEMLEPQGQA